MYCFFDGLLIKSRGLSTSATPMTRTQVTDRTSIHQTFNVYQLSMILSHIIRCLINILFYFTMIIEGLGNIDSYFVVSELSEFSNRGS